MDRVVADARVPWRRSLLLRIFAVGALIAVVAVAAATWATVRATTVAVREAQQDSLHTDARIYDALVGYAATHPRWAGARNLVDRMARESDRRVSVTDEAGRVLVGSDASRDVRSPADARATVDALAVDPVLLASADAVQLPADPVTGPVPCEGTTCNRTWTVAPTGQVDTRVVPLSQARGGPPDETLAAKTMKLRWRGVVGDVDSCLRRDGLGRTREVTGSFAVVVAYPQRHGAVAACADEARRRWYDGHVASPALLFVSGDAGSAEVFWDLSRASQVRIALLAGAVLAVTLALCLLVAGSVVRPLRRMATAAHLAGDGDLTARVPVHSRRDEIGELATAFNRMADRRQQLEDARRRLVSDVSHELRTPLANVRGWLEAAGDGLVEPDDRLVESLHEETLQLQSLVDDLHQLALGDAGELRIEPVDIDVPVFLGQVATSFEGGAGAAGVALRVDAEAGTTVRADPVRIRQAVGNLVANALRHTPAGGTVTLRGRDDLVEVADTGAGIAADDLPHVFERFRRADPARSRATGGSGLGLAIVRQIAEVHGGAVGIESAVGVGTTVRITLPRS